MNLDKLKDKFDEKYIEWKPNSVGINTKGEPWALVLAYIDARAIMDRLDDVCGPENWKDEYHHSHNGKGVMCTISICHYDKWIDKQDGAEETDIESFKGGISNAFKRCAVKWGIGRYLYDLDVCFAETSLDYKEGWRRAYDKKTNTAFYWKKPTLPSWALPPLKPEDYIMKTASFAGNKISSLDVSKLKKYALWIIDNKKSGPFRSDLDAIVEYIEVIYKDMVNSGLDEIDPDDLRSYADWMEQTDKKKFEPAIKIIDEYLKANR